MTLPGTLGDLRVAVAEGRVRRRPVRDEVRDNLIRRLHEGVTVFPGIIGYDESVVPQIINAVLARHHFILLGLRGQAKSRIARSLTDLLDDALPVMPDCEIHDDPLSPLCGACRERIHDEGEATPVEWLPRDARFVEKLATPDVTIADMIGDIDPIKAARQGRRLSDDLTMHFGLLPRAHRGLFVINELPDLAGRIQVGLFNILQEGDVQIKGYPVRLRLDVMMVFTANPEDYTARGKIISPLKDRIGAEIRTHYPATRHEAMAITAQEAWIARDQTGDTDRSTYVVPAFVREVIEEIAFQARADQKVDRRSGVSQRLPISTLETVVSNAERRAIAGAERRTVARVADVYAALPSMTGKFELEYEGELRGADNVARDLIRSAVANVFTGWFDSGDLRTIVDWFELGGTLQVSDQSTASELLDQAGQVQGLVELAGRAGAGASDPDTAAAVDFVLEGLYALKKIGRSDGWTYRAVEAPPRQVRPVEPVLDPQMPLPDERRGRKKYYN